jgi:hypothetical protein
MSAGFGPVERRRDAVERFIEVVGIGGGGAGFISYPYQAAKSHAARRSSCSKAEAIRLISDD